MDWKKRKIWDVVLPELSTLPQTLVSVYTIIKKHFSDQVFCEECVNNRIVMTTYGELFKQSQCVANFILKKLGNAHTQDRIFLQSKNSKNWVACFWGILQSGYTPVFLDPQISDEYFQHVKAKLKPKLVINHENIDDVVSYQCFDNITNNFANAFILLSSGTMGLPKIVEFDGKAVYAQLLLAHGIIKRSRTIRNFNKVSKLKLLMFLPLHHVFGLMANFLWFTFFGFKFVFVNSLNTEEIQAACIQHKVTHFMGVPIVWETVSKKIWQTVDELHKSKALSRAIKFSNLLQTLFPRVGLWFAKKIFRNIRGQALGNSLIFCINGGASMNNKTTQLMNGLGYCMHQGYGMTETGIVSVELSKHAYRRNAPTLGRPFKNINWRINDRRILELNGPMLSKRIIKEDQTWESSRDNWYTTNDMFASKHKRLLMLGRNDDMIVSIEGTKINPEQIESHFAFPNGIQCVALPLKLPSGYDKIILIVCSPSSISNEMKKKIIADIFAVIKKMPISEKPRDIYFTDILPLMVLGKVARHVMKNKFINSQASFIKIKSNVPAIHSHEIYSDKISSMLAKIKKCYATILEVNVDAIDDYTDFTLDLGGTSLDYYNLVNKINNATGKEIKLTSTKPLTTPLDFALSLVNE